MRELVVGDLRIGLHENPDPLIEWSGVSLTPNPNPEISAFFSTLVDDLRGKKVTIDFIQLEYLNSIVVIAIIKLLQLLNSEFIETEVLYDKNSHWQVSAFKALESLASMMKNISVYGV